MHPLVLNICLLCMYINPSISMYKCYLCTLPLTFYLLVFVTLPLQYVVGISLQKREFQTPNTDVTSSHFSVHPLHSFILLQQEWLWNVSCGSPGANIKGSIKIQSIQPCPLNRETHMIFKNAGRKDFLDKYEINCLYFKRVQVVKHSKNRRANL